MAMKTICTMEKELSQIGQRLVECTNSCEGVAVDQSSGILPRCLYFERAGRGESRGCVVVGINPGISKPDERAWYRDNGASYETVLQFWKEHNSKVPYHTRLRHLVEQLGYEGPILWTELAKCENMVSGDKLPLQTFRTCTGSFLSKELEIIPEDWPIIAVGNEPFKALAYLFPERTIIGVPHPTGARGHFAWLFDDHRHLRESVRHQLTDSAGTEGAQAVWLSVGSSSKMAIHDNSVVPAAAD